MTKKRTEQLAIPILDPGRQGLATGWKPWPYPIECFVWRAGDRYSVCGIKDPTPRCSARTAEAETVYEAHHCPACISTYEEITGRTGAIPR